MARVLGVDLGERRIGLALSDSSGTLASPLRTLEVTGDPDRDRLAIVSAARDAEAQVIVVGLPRSLSGAMVPLPGEPGQRPRPWPRLRGRSGWSCTTSGSRRARPTGPWRRRASGGARRARVDAAAAAIILQSYLDAEGK